MIPVYALAPQVRSFFKDGFADVFVPIHPQPTPKGSYVSRENTELNCIEWCWSAVADMDRIMGPPPLWHIELCPVALGAEGRLHEPIQIRQFPEGLRAFQVYYNATQHKQTMTFTVAQMDEVEPLLNKSLVAKRMPSWLSRGTCKLESAEPACQRHVWGWLMHWVKK